jgi:integrase/recombinase XerD
MQIDKPAISIIIDTRRPLASGKFPVKLRATFCEDRSGKKKWIQKYYPCTLEDGKPIHLSVREFDSVMDKPRAEDLRQLKSRLLDIQAGASSILKRHTLINKEIFERDFFGAPLTGVIPFFTKYIDELTATDQIGTARVYRTARNSFKAFWGEPSFHEVNEGWIKKYVAWMRAKQHFKKTKTGPVLLRTGSAVTTIAINLRCLRKIFNLAIKGRFVSSEFYPFGHQGFSIQEERKPKKALSEAQKNQVLTFKTKDPDVRKALDYWILSYFCNGINFADIARLQFKDIQDGMMRVDRTKTVNTDKIRRTVEIPVRKEVAAIIAAYSKKSLDPNEYIFPILEKGLSMKQQKFRIEDWIASTNNGLRKVAGLLGFKFRFTTVIARHTFANILLLNGADKAFIQEALTHSSITTTELYTGSFDIETKKKMSRKL